MSGQGNPAALRAPLSSIIARHGALAADLLTIVVPTFNPNPRPATEKRAAERASKYPSVNELGANSHRAGRKSDEYHWLFASIRGAAAAEMMRTGWWTADYYVDVYWSRIVTTRRPFDPMNALKAELDSMEPSRPGEPYFAGVYANDRLVIPHPQPPQYDPTPGAVDRIRILVERRWYPLIVPAIDLTVRPKRVRSTDSAAAAQGGEEHPKGATSCGDRVRPLSEIKNGETVSFEERDAILRGAS